MLVSTCHAPTSSTIDAISKEEHSLLPVLLPAPKTGTEEPWYRRKPFNFGFNYKFCEMFLCPGFTITKLKKCAEGKRYDPFFKKCRTLFL
ncbi:hypothetical protein CEXT_358211 [Caerostris extrusa]|uniref:Chitin-binding type-2 domain-containing protein n=1 Tax=Caerostris extrusa TaxID=172846 RepID=A0AAV4Y428_CAEEX|nr:hypothetical protein CEXT_358211 [Caerostris extrusa]